LKKEDFFGELHQNKIEENKKKILLQGRALLVNQKGRS
jgi:hypothetical protein